MVVAFVLWRDATAAAATTSAETRASANVTCHRTMLVFRCAFTTGVLLGASGQGNLGWNRFHKSGEADITSPFQEKSSGACLTFDVPTGKKVGRYGNGFSGIGADRGRGGTRRRRDRHRLPRPQRPHERRRCDAGARPRGDPH